MACSALVQVHMQALQAQSMHARTNTRRDGRSLLGDTLAPSVASALALSLLVDAHPQYAPRIAKASRACAAACAAMQFPQRYERARASQLLAAARRTHDAAARGRAAVRAVFADARGAWGRARRLVRRACVDAISDEEAIAYDEDQSKDYAAIDPADQDAVDGAAWDLAEERTDAFFAQCAAQDEDEHDEDATPSRVLIADAAKQAIAAAPNADALNEAVSAVRATRARARACCAKTDELEVAAARAAEAVVDFYALLRLVRARQTQLLRAPFAALVAEAFAVDAGAAHASHPSCSAELDARTCALRLRAPKAVVLVPFALRYQDGVMDADGAADVTDVTCVEGIDAVLHVEGHGEGHGAKTSRALVWQLPPPPAFASDAVAVDLVYYGATVWSACGGERERAIATLPEVEPFRACSS